MATARWSSMKSMRVALPPAPVRAEAVGRAAGRSLRSAATLQLQLGAAEDVAVAADATLPVARARSSACVVAEPVGADHDAAAAELDVAFGHGVEVGPAAHLARRRMIGSWRAASPRGGGCSARRGRKRGAGRRRGRVGCILRATPRRQPAATASSAGTRQRARDACGLSKADAARRRHGGRGVERARAAAPAAATGSAARCGGAMRFVESIIHEALAPPRRRRRPPDAVRNASRRTRLRTPSPGPIRARAARLRALARARSHRARARRREPARRRRSDASFRRYFRVDGARAAASSSWTRRRRRRTCGPFVARRRAARAAGLHAPARARGRRRHGFLLLTDLGSAALPRGAAGGAGARRRDARRRA